MLNRAELNARLLYNVNASFLVLPQVLALDFITTGFKFYFLEAFQDMISSYPQRISGFFKPSRTKEEKSYMRANSYAYEQYPAAVKCSERDKASWEGPLYKEVYVEVDPKPKLYTKAETWNGDDINSQSLFDTEYNGQYAEIRTHEVSIVNTIKRWFRNR